MANEKGSSRGPQRSVNYSSQEYAILANNARKICPSWHPEALREIIRTILLVASPDQVTPGACSAASYIPGAGVLKLHFDGKGRVMIDPESDFTHPLRELAKALRLVMGDKLTVGRPGVME
jgi:hypothetical protein